MATIPYLRLLRSGGVPTFGIAAFVAHGGGSGEPQFYVDCDDVRGRTQNTRNFARWNTVKSQALPCVFGRALGF